MSSASSAFEKVQVGPTALSCCTDFRFVCVLLSTSESLLFNLSQNRPQLTELQFENPPDHDLVVVRVTDSLFVLRRSSSPMPALQFSPLSSSISPTFWQSLGTLKLHTLGLSTEPVPVWASYSRPRSTRDRQTGEEVEFSCVLEDFSFVDKPNHVQGILHNYNTIEEFKSVNKLALLESVAQEVNKSPHARRSLR